MAVIVLFLFAGCGPRMPYAEHTVAPDKAMVYVYRPKSVNAEGSLHEIVIDGSVRGRVDDSGYFPVPVDPGRVDITVRNSDIVVGTVENKTVHLENARAGGVYYVKVDLSREDIYSVKLVDAAEARGEIAKTFLYDSTRTDINLRENSAAYTAAPAKEAPSSLDELERLFALKEKGALTQEEFERMKAKIIAE